MKYLFKYLGITYLICFILALLKVLKELIGYLLYNILRFLWKFKWESWYNYKLIEKDSHEYFKLGYTVHDKNPWQTFLRAFRVFKNFDISDTSDWGS